MFITIIIISLLSTAWANPTKPQQPKYDLENLSSLVDLFNNYKIDYNKIYGEGEEMIRFSYFVKNLKEINEMNQRNPLTVFDINHFTDWSDEEFDNLLGCQISSGFGAACNSGDASDVALNATAAVSLDWRQKGAVTPVQNQGLCSSCWAFATTGAVEGAFFLKHQNLIKLSEQQLVDCDKNSNGCHGGNAGYALTYLIGSGGQELEADYPYNAERGQCAFVPGKAQVRVSSCTQYINIKEDKIASLLNSVGPLYMSLDGKKLKKYHGGIFHECANGENNHGVLVVGYGEEGGVPYWIIKNSWGSSWGLQGFAKIRRGVNCIDIGAYVAFAEVA